MHIELPRRIYQVRPDLVLNIDNEYVTFLLMEQLQSKSKAIVPCLTRAAGQESTTHD